MRPLSAALAATLSLAALAATLFAAPANAAPYSVWSCRDARGAPLPTDAWSPAGNAGSRTDTCASGGGLDVQLGTGDTAPGSISGYRFDVPRGVTIVRYTAWLAAQTAAVPSSQARYLAGLGQGDELQVPTVLDGCYMNAPTCTWGTFADPLAADNEVTLPVQLGGLALMAACASATDPCAPAADPPARAALFRSVVELDDPAAPTVGPVTAPRAVAADLRDAGSGVRRVQLLVDGRVVDTQDQPGACRPPYTVADPCPRSLRATFPLDTARLASGRHAVAIRAVDAAGNAAQSAPATFSVVHPAPPPPRPPTLQLATPRRVRLPAARRITGTARAADGTPLAGIRMRFQQRPFDGDDWRDLPATAVTDAGGSFRLPVPRSSGQIRALAPPTFTATPAVTDFVRPLAATIRASRRRLRNGDRLTLRGRLLHAGGAADGRTVLIQSRVGGRWRSVDSTETTTSGRITWRYRFTRTRATARYRFRFVVPRAKRLPWPRLVTRQVSVVVRAATTSGG